MNTTAPHKNATKKKENQTAADSGDKTTGSAGGFLGLIEKIGNKLPNPVWLFVILAGIVALSSWDPHWE